jgi:uncharacterized protein (TIGR02996 family)
MAVGSLREFGCESCRIIEDRRTDAPDLKAWLGRWYPSLAGAVAGAERLVASGPTAEELHEQIVARPYDDAPRLAYATVVERRSPAYAEFIRLQIERYYDEAARGVRRSRPGPRESELYARHHQDWSRHIRPLARGYRADAPYQGVSFERGFVTGIRTEPEMVADMGDQLLRTAPIEHLTLTANGPFLDALTSPTLGRMRSLLFNAIGLGDDEAVALAERGHLDRCDYLELTGNRIGRRGLAALLANDRIRTMPVVLLHLNPCDPHVQVDDDPIGMGLTIHGTEAERQYGRISWLHRPFIDPTAPDEYHVWTYRHA